MLPCGRCEAWARLSGCVSTFLTARFREVTPTITHLPLGSHIAIRRNPIPADCNCRILTLAADSPVFPIVPPLQASNGGMDVEGQAAVHSAKPRHGGGRGVGRGKGGGRGATAAEESEESSGDLMSEEEEGEDDDEDESGSGEDEEDMASGKGSGNEQDEEGEEPEGEDDGGDARGRKKKGGGGDGHKAPVKKAAAAMAVGVGSFSDPEDIQVEAGGMGHDP